MGSQSNHDFDCLDNVEVHLTQAGYGTGWKVYRASCSLCPSDLPHVTAKFLCTSGGIDQAHGSLDIPLRRGGIEASSLSSVRGYWPWKGERGFALAHPANCWAAEGTES